MLSFQNIEKNKPVSVPVSVAVSVVFTLSANVVGDAVVTVGTVGESVTFTVNSSTGASVTVASVVDDDCVVGSSVVEVVVG